MPSIFRLTMQRGPTVGKIFDLTKDVMTIGRDVTNDITINDAEVSRHHARLTRQANVYTLEDLGSTNGAFVNSLRLTGPRALTAGDIVGFGETVTLIYDLVQTDVAATVVGSLSSAEVAGEAAKTQWDGSPIDLSMPDSAPPMTAPAMAEAPQDQAPMPPIADSTYDPTPPRPKIMGMDRRWVAAGCGCLTLLCCVVTVVAVFLWNAPESFWRSLGLG
ncbi:MAG: FHA domain-containing protein [Chloroflexi bacterium]|nr:FHA domain-containing protein [Chloroflexota bacterium]